ncbi:response regulator transcription factor [Arthrobacter sp. ISL-28]|jgi:DNA-binding response OmpR family regulator|uniref:response regulator transcription factor n=1 Tax=Arthrobacter sp. ISL-28 TaxID=2819108 RepID=UPI001BEA5188|nr:response regulator transcription factor [Arthrobacter sp. ISL-28]MBT2521308.1 response regulator transcription factor [Arthrobacter sp. ISL-28]
MGELGVALVIEDDDDVRNLVDAVLQQAGFEVYSAGTGREGVEVARQHQASIITLDVGLPDIDGFEVLRRLRQFSDAYVVMLTGRDDELDTITALQGGADDYITKPFRPRELRARISAMMRRPRQAGQEESPSPVAAGEARVRVSSNNGVLVHNGLALDMKTRTVSLKGTPVGLTRSEFDLLQDLLKGTGAVRTRADLVRVVRGEYYRDDTYISEADERAVEVHIGNLRRKLREDPNEPRWLVTVRGVGYRLAPKRPE